MPVPCGDQATDLETISGVPYSRKDGAGSTEHKATTLEEQHTVVTLDLDSLRKLTMVLAMPCAHAVPGPCSDTATRLEVIIPLPSSRND